MGNLIGLMTFMYLESTGENKKRSLYIFASKNYLADAHKFIYAANSLPLSLKHFLMSIVISFKNNGLFRSVLFHLLILGDF